MCDTDPDEELDECFCRFVDEIANGLADYSEQG